jgi:uncharacterized protein (DUF39 family)
MYRLMVGWLPWIAIWGATEATEDDPLNKVHPGQFNYGGAHVIQDLVAGKTMFLKQQPMGRIAIRTNLWKRN